MEVDLSEEKNLSTKADPGKMEVDPSEESKEV